MNHYFQLRYLIFYLNLSVFTIDLTEVSDVLSEVCTNLSMISIIMLNAN